MSLMLLAFFVTVLLPQLTFDSIWNDQQASRYAIALAAYSVIYLGAVALCARLLRRVVQRILAYHVLAILVLANLLLVVGAEVIHFLSRVPPPQLYDVVNPVVTLQTIADADRGSVDAVSCLVVAAVVAMAANVSALWRGVWDIVTDPVRAPDREPAASRWGCRLAGVSQPWPGSSTPGEPCFSPQPGTVQRDSPHASSLLPVCRNGPVHCDMSGAKAMRRLRIA